MSNKATILARVSRRHGAVAPGPWPVEFRALGWCALVLVLLEGCGVRGNGDYAVSERTVEGFFSATLDAPVLLTLLVNPLSSGEVTLKLEGDENLLPLLHTTVSNGTLLVSTGEDILKPTQPLILVAEVPQFISLETQGSASATVAGLDNLHIFVTAIDQSSVNLSGRTDWLDVSADGRARVSALSLTAMAVTLAASGGATLEVCAEESLEAAVGSAAAVRYGCTPVTVSSSVSEGGLLEPM